MGYLKDKYTKEYFTGQDKDGNELNYGVTKFLDDDGNYNLRSQDRQILEKVDFKGKKVLALGCGRGEELAYVIENGANSQNTVGVDFSSAAIKICKKMFADKKIEQPRLIVDDALDFVSGYKKEVKKDKSKRFDIVIMFDFVEHVPRNELSKTLTDLKVIIDEGSLIVINTPAYKYDNDVIEGGFDDRNLDDLLDLSDKISETQGMHCNKYSLISLQRFMESVGYINVTEAHFYVKSEIVPKDFSRESFFDRWSELKENGFPFLADYEDDVIEVPYRNIPDVKLLKFNKGNLKGISIFTTEENKKIAFPDGNTDPEMIISIRNLKPIGKTVFDVGTFIGTSAMLFSEMVGDGGKVIGFEPNVFNKNRTFLNLSHNSDLSKQIFVYDFAIGSDNKKQKLLLSSNIDGGHSSTSRLKGSHSTIHDDSLPDGFEDIEVEVMTLDNFVREYDASPDIIKVDIEGAEYDFLLGSLATIRNKHPIFYIELHSQYCAVKCSEMLIFEGYSIEILNEEEDNRIIVKAEYNGAIQNRSINQTNLRLMKDLNNAFFMTNEVLRISIDSNKECQRVIGQNVAEIRTLEEKIIELNNTSAELQKNISELHKNISDIYNSKRYRVINKIANIKGKFLK